MFDTMKTKDDNRQHRHDTIMLGVNRFDANRKLFLFCSTNDPINNEIMKKKKIASDGKSLIDAIEYSIETVIRYLFSLALKIEDDNRRDSVP